MGQVGLTTAAIISFSESLEDGSSAFYGELAERWPDQQDSFRAFALEGKKNKTLVVRTYQETISDALEASYCFEGLNLGQYETKIRPAETASLVECLEQAVTLEETAYAFYLDVAERSESLLATIPRAFKRVAKKRNKRKTHLEELLSVALSSL
jgi:rubrerythrin